MTSCTNDESPTDLLTQGYLRYKFSSLSPILPCLGRIFTWLIGDTTLQSNPATPSLFHQVTPGCPPQETLHPFPPLHSLPSSSPTGWQPAAPPTLGLLQTLHHMAFLWLLWSTLMAAPVQGIFDRNNHVQWYMINDHICPFCFSQILSSHSPLLLIGFESGRGGRVVRCGGKSSSLGSLLKVTRWNKLKCNLL